MGLLHRKKNLSPCFWVSSMALSAYLAYSVPSKVRKHHMDIFTKLKTISLSIIVHFANTNKDFLSKCEHRRLFHNIFATGVEMWMGDNQFQHVSTHHFPEPAYWEQVRRWLYSPKSKGMQLLNNVRICTGGWVGGLSFICAGSGSSTSCKHAGYCIMWEE